MSAAPRGYVFYVVYALNENNPHGAADTEQHTLFMFSGYFSKMAPDCGNYIAVYGRVRELSEFIKNIIICVPKMNGSQFTTNQETGFTDKMRMIIEFD